MNQPEFGFASEGYRPPVRRSDPPTSHQAAQHIAPKLTGLRLQMYEAFRIRAMTSNEAADYCVRQIGGMHESYRKRTKELFDSGWIREDVARRCGYSGQAAMTFRVRR